MNISNKKVLQTMGSVFVCLFISCSSPASLTWLNKEVYKNTADRVLSGIKVRPNSSSESKSGISSSSQSEDVHISNPTTSTNPQQSNLIKGYSVRFKIPNYIKAGSDLSTRIASEREPEWSFHEGMLLVNNGDDNNPNYGFIDKDGNLVIPMRYSHAEPFSCNRAVVGKQTSGDGWESEIDGYINKNGNLVIPYKYEAHHDNTFVDNFATVYDYGKDVNSYILDANGNKLCCFPYLETLGEGRFSSSQGGRIRLLDTNGRVLSEFESQAISMFNEDLATVTISSNKVNIINKEGQVLGSLLGYTPIDVFHEGLMLVCKETNSSSDSKREYGYVNSNGQLVVPCKYEIASSFHEGLACVLVNGKYGYIDKDDHLTIPNSFDEAGNFSEGLAPVSKNDKVGYIDKEGNVVIPFVFQIGGPFKEGVALVCKNGSMMVIQRQ